MGTVATGEFNVKGIVSLQIEWLSIELNGFPSNGMGMVATKVSENGRNFFRPTENKNILPLTIR